MASYSGTPLPQKLGLKPRQATQLVHAPSGYEAILGISESVNLHMSTDSFDWLQAFYTNRASLESEFSSLKVARTAVYTL